MRHWNASVLLIGLALALFLNGCGFFSPINMNTQADQFKAQQTHIELEPSSLSTEENTVIEFVSPIPAALQEKILQAQDDKMIRADAPIRVETTEDTATAGTWIYVAATAFSSLQDEITEEQIRGLWQGKALDNDWTHIYIQEADQAILSARLGEPDTKTVSLISEEGATQLAWKEPQSLFLFPFEQLNPRWKILQFDGRSIFSRPFDANTYPLAFSYAFESESPVTVAVDTGLPYTNYDQTKMATVLMTGVTALVRATGAKMDTEGVDFPASTIKDVLLDADLTHISNEVSFAEDCPLAKADQADVMFCSRPEYFDLLTDTDVDLVELSGNHLIDWSMNAFIYSLKLYQENGIPYYAAGDNQQDARKPYKVEINGNKLAFVGCNPAGPKTVWATDTLPGVANCADDWLVTAVDDLVQEGYLPIVTMQHFETYAMEPNPYQKADFLKLSAHGAVIVSGSQAHLPQGMTFVGDHFIHFGLGNLFFDQMDIPVVGTRREFLDRHVFYDGKYIQTELITAMLEDYARPRLMTEEERMQFLTDIFGASGWIKDEE